MCTLRKKKQAQNEAQQAQVIAGLRKAIINTSTSLPMEDSKSFTHFQVLEEGPIVVGLGYLELVVPKKCMNKSTKKSKKKTDKASGSGSEAIKISGPGLETVKESSPGSVTIQEIP